MVTIHFTYESPDKDINDGLDLFDKCIDFFDNKLKKKFKVDDFIMGSKPYKKEDYE